MEGILTGRISTALIAGDIDTVSVHNALINETWRGHIHWETSWLKNSRRVRACMLYFDRSQVGCVGIVPSLRLSSLEIVVVFVDKNFFVILREESNMLMVVVNFGIA